MATIRLQYASQIPTIFMTYHFQLAKLSQSLTKQVNIMNGCFDVFDYVHSTPLVWIWWVRVPTCRSLTRSSRAILLFPLLAITGRANDQSQYRQRGASTRKITVLVSNLASLTMSPSRSWLYCCVYITFHEWVKLNMADWEKGRKWFQREEVSSGNRGRNP